MIFVVSNRTVELPLCISHEHSYHEYGYVSQCFPVWTPFIFVAYGHVLILYWNITYSTFTLISWCGETYITCCFVYLKKNQGGVSCFYCNHYNDVIMGVMASQITSPTSVYSTAYSGLNHRKHQSSASLAFVRGNHRGPVNSPHKWPVTRKMFPFDDVIMVSSIPKWYS